MDLSACPASQGLRAFNASSTAAARRVSAQFNAFTSSFYGDLRSSDRSWWEGLFGTWSGAGYDLDTHTVVSVGPASRDTFSAAVARACGERIVQGSVVVVVGPSGLFQVSHLYFLDRNGTRHLLPGLVRSRTGAVR